MLVVLVSWGWGSKLCSVGTWLLYYASLFFFTCDSVPIWLMNVFPFCHQTSQPKKPFRNPKTLVLLDWIFEIVLAYFFVVWKQFLAQTQTINFKVQKGNMNICWTHPIIDGWSKLCFLPLCFSPKLSGMHLLHLQRENSPNTNL